VERRHILFIVLTVLVLGAHFALLKWLTPQQQPPVVQKDDEKKAKDGQEAAVKGDKKAQGKDKQDDAQGKPKQAEVKDPATAKPEVPAVKPASKSPITRVTLGSLDRSSGYPGVVTLVSHGAAVERVELGGDGKRQYFDTDDKTGYLGHLALTATDDGCRVGAVGPGTPAFLAKETAGKISGGLAAEDVIIAMGGQKTGTPTEVERLLRKTKAGQPIEIDVLRQVNGKRQTLSFRAQLTQHPLEVIRPETHEHEGETVTDPLSFLVSLDRVGERTVRPGEAELSLLPSLRDANWELTKSSADSAEFTYRMEEADLTKIDQNGSLRIVKRFTLARRAAGNAGMERPYSLHMQIEIHNDLATATPLAYRLWGPNGLPLEGWWYLTKLHPRMFHSAGARDVVWRQPDSGQQLLGCRAIYDGAVKSKKEKDLYEPTLLEQGNKSQPLEYVGVDTQFFAAIIKPQKVGDKDILYRKAFAESVQDASQLKTEYSRTTNVSVVLATDAVKVEPGGVLTHDYEIFLGPKDPDVLVAYRLDYLIEKGWLIFMYPTNFLSWVLHLLYSFTGNYGIAIVLLTVIVRACMLPLSIKQAKNAAKMQELAPEIKKIKEKYAGDTEKQMKAQQELYKKHNFNMFGGCLPVLIQLPIFIGLYRCLSVDIALRDAPLIPGFWWASNLAGPDKLFYWKDWLWPVIAGETGYLGPYFNLLPVITCILFILQQQLFMPPATDEQSQMQQSMMKYMTIIMGVLFFKVPTGLCIYFIISTSWSIVERTFLPKFKPAEGGAPPQAKSAAAGPGPNGSPADKRGPKAKKR
jgi:YidC/Oxa1 family membrane protein insertase